MKLYWEMIAFDSQWAKFLRARYMRKMVPAPSHIHSSICPGLKQHIVTVLNNSSWQVGDGEKN